ncbi:MAG TPA: choice-of-anchor D domain-containing protein [Terriglobales bacterium]
MNEASSARQHASDGTTRFWTAASLLLLLSGISLLTGCAGLSAGNRSNTTQQQEVGNLSLGSSSLDFGSVAAGSSKTLSVTATNSGSAAVTVNNPTFSNNQFSVTSPAFPATIAAGQSSTLTLAFTPNAAGTASGTVTFSSSASNSTISISLSGIGVAAGQLTANPSNQAFGNVTAGTQQTGSETVTNTGGTSITISKAAITGTGFSLSGINTPVTLDAGESTPFTITFAPQSAGAASGKVTLTSDAPNPTLSISLSGTGVAAGQLTANPSSKAFGNVTVGNQLSASETVTNSGGTSVTISKAAVSGTGFSINGISAPVTLTAGQSASFTMTFTPQSAAAASGTVTLSSNASNPTLRISLSGTGVNAGQLTANPPSQNFGSVTSGTQQTVSETVTNTGGTSVTISEANITGTGFTMSGLSTPKTLTAGQSTTFNLTFAPQATGSASGMVTLTSNAPNPTLQISLSGTGTTAGQLTANPPSQNFGNVTSGTQQTVSETVTNTGGTSVTISQANITGTGFTMSGLSTPKTLTAGQSTTFNLTFGPQTTGSASGMVTLTSNAPNPTIQISLSGTGAAVQAGQLSVTPTTLALGSVVVGDSGSASGSLSATGASVTVTAATSNNSAFTVSGLSLPVTIPAGKSVPFTITFSPQAAGSANAKLTITSDAQSPTLTETLTGTGTTAPTHSVNLSWTASTSSDVAGYNVYRALYSGSSCGAMSKINSVLDTTTVYTDSTVANSTAYCYATTAVDSSSQESSYSNIVSNIAIP